jgi:hypothetical protein
MKALARKLGLFQAIGLSTSIIAVTAAMALNASSSKPSGKAGCRSRPLRLRRRLTEWSGIGYGLVFTVLSFAGFEGAATLGGEVASPCRNLPVAIAGTVMLAGGFFIFVSYAQVIGYGLDQIAKLGNADAPLNDLAVKFVSKDFATAIDLAAAVSAFACVIGSLSAATRLLFALGRAGLAPRIGEVNSSCGTPAASIVLTGGLCVVGILVSAPFVGATDYYGYLATIGTLALILVYVGVTGAELAESLGSRRMLRALFGLSGMLVLFWPLCNSIYPIPNFPAQPLAICGHRLDFRRCVAADRSSCAARGQCRSAPASLTARYLARRDSHMTVGECEDRFRRPAPSWHQILMVTQSPNRNRNRSAQVVLLGCRCSDCDADDGFRVPSRRSQSCRERLREGTGF